MEKIHLKRLTQHCWKGSQSWNYQATWDTGQHRLRVTFKRDSYDDQSYARVEALDPDRVTWNPLHHIPIREFSSVHKIGAYQDGVTVRNFAAAEETILDEATKILYGSPEGPKIELRDVQAKLTGFLKGSNKGCISFRVFVDDDCWGAGDLWAEGEGDLCPDGFPTVGGSGDWVVDDDMMEEVRCLAIEKAKEMGMTWWTVK